jgi:hypothetical protein
MVYRLIAWDLTQNPPETLSDIWGTQMMLKEELKRHKKQNIFARGMIIDYSTKPPTVIEEVIG